MINITKFSVVSSREYISIIFELNGKAVSVDCKFKDLVARYIGSLLSQGDK